MNFLSKALPNRILHTRIAGLMILCAGLMMSVDVRAQDEVRYSWFEISYVGQDVSRQGSQISLASPLDPQLVEIDAQDGDGIKFRGSIGTWNNLYLFVDFASSDIDVSSLVTVVNTGVMASGMDEFDYTAIRGGVGVRWPIAYKIDLYGEVSYDSLDLDFGSLVGENFDSDAQDVGAAIGVRGIVGNNIELRAWGRYAGVGDANLNNPGSMDTDTLFGAGFGFQIVPGLSITGDYEAGEFSSWNIGFRLDISED